MSEKKLLIVDDEQENRQALQDIFSEEYQVFTAKDGVEALERIGEVQPDLVMLDIMMPRMDGFQTCLRIRQQEATRNTPVIFLTPKAEPETESFGLDLGADDFVRKPFNKEVLKARVKKRLTAQVADRISEMTALDDYIVEWDRHEVRYGEDAIALTAKEIGLLRLFVENRGRVLSRNLILEKIWSDTYITDRTIDSHVKELRKKIPPLINMLKTVYGSGYRLDL